MNPKDLTPFTGGCDDGLDVPVIGVAEQLGEIPAEPELTALRFRPADLFKWGDLLAHGGGDWKQAGNQRHSSRILSPSAHLGSGKVILPQDFALRFKGSGQSPPDEFSSMIGPDMRLNHVEYEEGNGVKELLAFYMGKNTPDRQDYIIENLRDDVDKQIDVAVAVA